ncbi:MAG: hypothetical protein HY873_00285 [Chloroflexi bacterium]|nr:hypothetical protein [Chloroflexota bacterium]
MNESVEERARLREADRLIEEIVMKLRQNKAVIAGSLAFGRVSWHGSGAKREIHLEPKL